MLLIRHFVSMELFSFGNGERRGAVVTPARWWSSFQAEKTSIHLIQPFAPPKGGN